MQRGDGCVVVTEGTYEQTKAALLRPKYALDLATGKRIGGTAVAEELTEFKAGRVGDKWYVPTAEGYTLILSACCKHLYIMPVGETAAAQTHLLSLPEGCNLGTDVHVLKFDDTLVLGMIEGYVVCVDLSKLPQQETQTAQVETEN